MYNKDQHKYFAGKWSILDNNSMFFKYYVQFNALLLGTASWMQPLQAQQGSRGAFDKAC